MIRKRIASIDDTTIYKLIVEQLVPYSRVHNASAPLGLITIIKRLKRNTTFVVSRGSKRPLGFITLFRKDRILMVDMLAVSPEVQSRGYGKLLMQTAESYGRSKGCTSVHLYVDDSNPRAIQFYAARGYTTLQYVTHLSCYLMGKPLYRQAHR
ncbi:putative acetyltransferase [compost metagenome]